MSFPIGRPRTRRPAPVSWMTAMAVLALTLTGCAATSEPSSSTAAEATPEPSVAASPTADATASAAAEVCLPAHIITALREIGEGNFEPATPLNEVADELEALDLSQEEGLAEVRDELVTQLRDTDPDQTRQELIFAANVFLSDSGAPQC